MKDIIHLDYCPRLHHAGDTNEALTRPHKKCKCRKHSWQMNLYLCQPHPATHGYCKHNNIEYSLDTVFRCVLNKMPYISGLEVREFRFEHDMDFSIELDKARKVADYARELGGGSSKDVKHIGLNSVIANSILHRYRNREIDGDVPMILPAFIVKPDKFDKTLWMASLQLKLSYEDVIDVDFVKIANVEVYKDYLIVKVLVKPEGD